MNVIRQQVSPLIQEAIEQQNVSQSEVSAICDDGKNENEKTEIEFKIGILILKSWLNWPTSKDCMYAKINFKSFFLSHTINVQPD